MPGLEVVECVYSLTEEPATSRERYDASVAAVQVTCFRVVAPDEWEPTLDWEHDDHRWCAPEEAAAALRWPATAEALRRLLAARRFRVLPAADAFWRPSNQMDGHRRDVSR